MAYTDTAVHSHHVQHHHHARPDHRRPDGAFQLARAILLSATVLVILAAAFVVALG
jgi:hypothetical protein